MPHFSEDTVIFNALTPSITDMSKVYRVLEKFFQDKKAIDTSDRFGLVVFRDDGPDNLDEFTLEPKHILNALKTLEPELDKARIAGGIFRSLSFIIQVFKTISEKCFRVIILTDAGTHPLPKEFLTNLNEIIDNVFVFPCIIDIVRINVEDKKQNSILLSLAKRSGGNLHKIKNVDSLSFIMDILAKKKEISSNSIVSGQKAVIHKKKQEFFENLAEKLIFMKTEETCSICHERDKRFFVQCPSCLTTVHRKCFAAWAKNSNIGIHHIFRCHQCYYLVKLDEEYVQKVQKETDTKPKSRLHGFQKWLEELESRQGPVLRHTIDPFEEKTQLFKLKIKQNKATGNITDMASIARRREVKNIFCVNCGSLISSLHTECPNCYFPV